MFNAVANHEEQSRIYLAASATAAERHAAGVLVETVCAISGATLPVLEFRGEDVPSGIFIGRGSGAEDLEQAVDWSALGDDGILLRCRDRRLLLAGGPVRGALYAVYEFLERVCGCRWLAPGETFLPKMATLTVPDMDVRHVPSFSCRDPHFLVFKRDPDWCVANRVNSFLFPLDAAHGGHWTYAGGFVHTLYRLVPPGEFFEPHPEYFSEVDGQRTTARAQLCLSNPEVLDLVVERLLVDIRENPDTRIVSVSQNDWFGYCTCKACRAVDDAEGGPVGSMIRFVNAVAERTEPHAPQVLIDTLAYTYTVNPPRTLRPHRNVIVRLCNMGACDCYPLVDSPAEIGRVFVGHVRRWTEISHNVFIWTYITNFQHYFQPYPNLNALFADIPFYAGSGVAGLMLQGDGSPSRGGSGLIYLRGWVLSRLMWDHTLDGWTLVDDFCRHYYGPAADAIVRYLHHLHDPFLERDDYRWSLYIPLMHPLFTVAWQTQARQLFDEAQAAVASDPVLAARVKNARLPVDYLEWKPQLKCGVRPDGMFGPLDERLHSKARDFFATARLAGAQSLRETGAPLDEEEAFISLHAVETLEQDGMRLTVIPSLGGRFLSLQDGQGREWLRPPLSGDLDYPVAGGYEEYSDLDYRTPGWREPYAVVRNEEGMVLTAALSNHFRLERWLEIASSPDGPQLCIDSTLTNSSPEKQFLILRAHPVFRLDPDARAVVRFQSVNGLSCELHPWDEAGRQSGSLWLREGDLPDSCWMLEQNGTCMTMAFQREETDRALLDWNVETGTLNMELFGKRQYLSPGDSVSLRQVWSFYRKADHPGLRAETSG